MENFNLVEILKDCPKGTKLYSPICGEVVFDHIHHNEIMIYMKNGTMRCFNHYGQYICGAKITEGECMLFPSKENRDWGSFNRNESYNFQPFDKVLVRDGVNGYWFADFFSNYLKDNVYKYCTSGGNHWRQCIPFEGNEHLVGTNKSE